VHRFLARRLTHGVAVIFIAASISFLLVHLAPGDPFSSTLESTELDPKTVAIWRNAYGLDRSLPEQYIRFLGQLTTGNLGPSISHGRPAAEVLANAVPHTLLLMGTALVLSLVIGVVVGAWQASTAGSRRDRVAGTVSLVVASLPEFWLGVMLVILFVYRLQILPGGGATDLVMHDALSPLGRVLDRVRHLVLPALTLALLGSASIARYQRAALLDVLPQDFVRTARAKGVAERRILWRHALRNALVPTIVLAGLSLPTLMGGAVFVEQVFAWPGMGQLAAKAFEARDDQLVTGAVILGAVLVVVGGILTDLLHAIVDPRVRAQ
jgi:peptide/nickel transport system permease protein